MIQSRSHQPPHRRTYCWLRRHWEALRWGRLPCFSNPHSVLWWRDHSVKCKRAAPHRSETLLGALQGPQESPSVPAWRPRGPFTPDGDGCAPGRPPPFRKPPQAPCFPPGGADPRPAGACWLRRPHWPMQGRARQEASARSGASRSSAAAPASTHRAPVMATVTLVTQPRRCKHLQALCAPQQLGAGRGLLGHDIPGQPPRLNQGLSTRADTRGPETNLVGHRDPNSYWSTVHTWWEAGIPSWRRTSLGPRPGLPPSERHLRTCSATPATAAQASLPCFSRPVRPWGSGEATFPSPVHAGLQHAHLRRTLDPPHSPH